jgi:CheY-like chemotaxis protein
MDIEGNKETAMTAVTAAKRILVVDDDPVVGKSFDRVLAPKGYAVIAASGGAEALERLAKEDYDVVYTDIKMPGMDGMEVARRIKASRPWLPVVIVTGYGTEANEAESRAIGVAGFLHKPLLPETIEASVTAATPALLPAPAAAEKRSAAKAALLLLAAPFISLAFVIVAPFAGLGALVWLAGKAAGARWPVAARFVKNAALFFAAPFIGLAYTIAAPFVGLGAIVWMAVRAARTKRSAQ